MIRQEQEYKFVFRTDSEVVVAQFPVRFGTAEATAKRLARSVAKECGSVVVSLIWMGPADGKIPGDIKARLSREAAI